MATSTNVAQFVGRMDKYQKAVKQASSLTAATKESVAVFEREIRRASGGDMRLSKVGTKGARVGVRTRTNKLGETTTSVLIAATGPLHLIEGPIKPHVITSKGLRGSRRSRAALVGSGGALSIRGRSRTFIGPTLKASRLKLPDGGYRFYVNHPGVSKPKKPWAKAEKDVLKLIPKIQTREFVKAMRNV